jgi:FPC/CPF motif-containing protein YcgG
VDSEYRAGFGQVIAATLCPFARSARVGWASGWQEALPDEENYSRIANELGQFCMTARDRRMHGFVVAIGDPAGGLTNLSAVERRFARTLAELDRRDKGSKRHSPKDVGKAGWQWEFCNLSLFLNVFSSCYKDWHPKHLPARGILVIFMQPSFSFDLCNANTDNVLVKKAIRQKFARAGRPYDGELVDRGIDSLLYMSPARPGDPPVAWFDPPGGCPKL